MKIMVNISNKWTFAVLISGLVLSLSCYGTDLGNGIDDLVGRAPPLPLIQPKPIVKIAPVYPEIAQKEHVSGSVSLFFNITPKGDVENAQVTDEYPKGYEFGRSALEQFRSGNIHQNLI